MINLTDNEDNSICTPLPPPPTFPDINNSTDKTTILEQMSLATNTSIKQIEQFIGEELQKAMGQMNPNELLLTLKTALKTANDKQQQERGLKRNGKGPTNNLKNKIRKLRY